MKKVWIGAAVVVLAVLVFLRIQARSEKAPARGIEEIQAEQGVPVDAVTLARDTLVVTRQVAGNVEGRRQTDVSAAGDRKVDKVFVREGQRVGRGDRLISYDIRTAPDAVARLQQSQAAYDNAQRQVNRLQPLYEQGAISEADLDNARTQLEVARANLRDARLQVEEVSPIDGVVTLVAVTPGESVTGGQTVAQVATLDSVRVSAEVAADAVAQLHTGAKVRVVPGSSSGTEVEHPAAGGPGNPGYEGRLTRVSLGADPGTRLYEVEAVLANRDRSFLPGQFVTLAVVTRRIDDALSVPRIAFLGEQEVVPGAEQEVFTVADGTAHRRKVTLGAVNEDRAQVTDGLQAGDVVVVFGANRLREGDKVRFHRLDGKMMEAPAASGAPASGPGSPQGTGEAGAGR